MSARPGGPPADARGPAADDDRTLSKRFAASENAIINAHGTTPAGVASVPNVPRLVDPYTKPFWPVSIMTTPSPGWTARVELRDRQNPRDREVDVLPVIGFALVDDDGERAIEPLIWWAGSPHTRSDLRWYLDAHDVRVSVVPPASVEALTSSEVAV